MPGGWRLAFRARCAAWKYVQRKYGKLPWATVVKPAAQLAANGWALSPALARGLNGALRGKSGQFPSTVQAYSKPGGGQWQEGDVIRLPALAHTLDEIASKGADVFYTGWIADSIDAQMRRNGGLISKADLAEYKAVERKPVTGTFLGYDIASMGPPSSGGTIIVETLNMLEKMGVEKMQRNSVEYLHRRIEAARLAYLDRARYLGDIDYVQVPLDRLLSKAYADSLVKKIDPSHALKSAEIGADIVTVAASEPDESTETTQFSVIDKDGMAVSNTYTLEGGYGSGVVVQGRGLPAQQRDGRLQQEAGRDELAR